MLLGKARRTETEKSSNEENNAREENRMGRKQQKMMKNLLFKGFMFIGNTTHFSGYNLR